VNFFQQKLVAGKAANDASPAFGPKVYGQE
jgi:hypothetical protein